MYETEIKLSNICAHFYEYFYRKHHQQVEFLPLDKKLSKLMDNELLKYFSNENNIRKYITTLIKDMFSNFRNFYAMSYSSVEESKIKELLKICSEDKESLNFVIDDLVNKNLQEVNNAIEIFKSNNNGNLETKEYNFYDYMRRQLGIESTYDDKKSKNEKLKQKIIDGRFFSDTEINVISKFADYVGYGWMLIWKNIDNIKVLQTERISSGWENDRKGYVGLMSGDLIIKDRISIMINDIKFTKDVSENINSSGFW